MKLPATTSERMVSLRILSALCLANLDRRLDRPLSGPNRRDFAVLISRRFSLSTSCARGAFSWPSFGSRHLISRPVFYSSAHRETRGWLGNGLGLALRAWNTSTWAGSGRSCSSWACSFGSPTFREIQRSDLAKLGKYFSMARLISRQREI